MPRRLVTRQDFQALAHAPLAERALPPSPYDLIQRTAARTPDAPALIAFARPEDHTTPQVIAYRTLAAEVTRAANLFHALGIRPGRTVSYLLPLLPQTHYALWGAEAAGIANPVNPLLEPEQIAEILNAADCELLLVPAPTLDGGEVWRKVEALAARVPTLRKVLVVGHDGGAPLPCLPTLPVEDFDARRATCQGESLDSGRIIDPTDIAAYFHTGGTTGTPKLARHTHGNQVYDGWIFAEMLDLPAEARLLCGLPLFHVNAPIITGIGPFTRGHGVVLAGLAGYRTPGLLDRMWAIIEHHRVAAFSAVPTLLSGLLDRPVSGDLSCLRYVICGAAPLPVETQRRFEAATGVRILEGYGLTEGTCASTMNPPDGERRAGSIGFPLPYQQVRPVVLDEHGAYVRDCAADEVGALVIAGPNVFPGYRQERHNAGLWVEIDGARWLNTGDLGRCDADGYLWLTGRKKELIIRGGHNIDPRTIEEALHRHPAVRTSAAVGRLDAYAGELPVAYVELLPGARAEEAELLAFAAAAIGERAAIPKAITIVDRLPTTAVGKLFKPALREREAETVCRQAVNAVPGAAGAEVSAGTDPRRGLVVRVRLPDTPDRAALEEAVRRALGRFAVACDLA